MAFKPRGGGNEPSALLGLLNNTKLQQTNPATYQVLQSLITIAGQAKAAIANAFTKDSLLPANQLLGLVPIKNGGTESGIYTPVLTNLANITTSTAFPCYWTRIGNYITVTGQVDIDVTANNALTQLELTLPRPSQFNNSDQAMGVTTAFDTVGTAHGMAGIVTAIVATNDVMLELHSTTNNLMHCHFCFTYLFIPLTI